MCAFILPRPPAHREGRRCEQFYSRPVSTVDVKSALTEGQSTTLVGIVDEDASQWFPAAATNRTSQDEFTGRTRIIQSHHEELFLIRAAHLQTRVTVLEQQMHSLVFDEQWEREAIQQDSQEYLWTLATGTTRQKLFEHLEHEEEVGRFAVLQLSIASFVSLVSTAEFVARRHLVSTFLTRLLEVRQLELEARQQSSIVIASLHNYNVIVAFEETCRKYLHLTRFVTAEQKEFVLEEALLRKQLVTSFWESRRIVVEYFAEEGVAVLWASSGKLSHGITAAAVLGANATAIQATFRGWSLRRRQKQKRTL